MKRNQTIITSLFALAFTTCSLQAQEELIRKTGDLAKETVDVTTGLVTRTTGVIQSTNNDWKDDDREWVNNGDWANDDDYWASDIPGFFIGIQGGQSTVKAKNNNRNEDGVEFDFTTEDDDLAYSLKVGYWVTDMFGLQFAAENLGNVTVPFRFNDPRNGRSGTGESEVDISGGSFSLLLATPRYKRFQAFARAGGLSWKRDAISRFDVVNEPSVERTQNKSGTSLVYGAGVMFKIAEKKEWYLNAGADFYDIDGDEVSVYGIGVTYSFGKPTDWR